MIQFKRDLLVISYIFLALGMVVPQYQNNYFILQSLFFSFLFPHIILNTITFVFNLKSATVFA